MLSANADGNNGNNEKYGNNGMAYVQRDFKHSESGFLCASVSPWLKTVLFNDTPMTRSVKEREKYAPLAGSRDCGKEKFKNENRSVQRHSKVSE